MLRSFTKNPLVVKKYTQTSRPAASTICKNWSVLFENQSLSGKRVMPLWLKNSNYVTKSSLIPDVILILCLSLNTYSGVDESPDKGPKWGQLLTSKIQ